MREDPHVCRRCALAGPTCCQLSAGQEEFCFPLSVLEKDRIRDHLPDLGGFASAPNSASFVDGLSRLFPDERREVKALFPAGKEHLRLAVDAHGACRFLSPGGCLVPREARPYYCRLFPFWITGERITLFETPFCLAQQEHPKVGDLLAVLGLTTTQVASLHGSLRLAWGLPPRPGMDAVKKGF
jgi:Fe-S-cluster containining protein